MKLTNSGFQVTDFRKAVEKNLDNYVKLFKALSKKEPAMEKKTEESKTYVDPPGGRKYGFPKVIKPGESYEELLRKSGYPEKDIEFALKYTRSWVE